MNIYCSQRISHQIEKDVLSILEKIKPGDLGNRISFGIASVSFSPKRWRDCEIDFLLVGSAGIYVLEVKGGKISIKDGVWHSTDHRGSSHIIDPFNQAKSNFYELWQYMRDNKVRLEKAVSGNFGCIFPEYQYTKLPDRAWAEEQYFDAGFMSNPAAYINRLIDSTQERFSKKKPLDAGLVQQIKTFLVPNYSDYIKDISSATDEKILLLSSEQSIVFDALSGVKRMLIEGPPGSGKTVLAVEQLIANERRGIRTLYLCFNRAIRNKVAFEVELRFKRPPNFITVSTITLAQNINERYDYLILDEAQDYLNDEELTSLGAYVKGGLKDGRFRIFIDPNQDTFGKSETSILESLKMRDDVVYYPLKYNYRNSARINAYVRKMTQLRVGDVRNNPEGVDPEICKIPYTSNSVNYIDYPRAVGEKINELLRSGVKPNEIMVVSISGRSVSALADRNQKHIKLINGVTLSLGKEIEWSKYAKANTIINGNAYDLKGLDSKIVICTDVFTKSEKEAALLVGMTRARSRLIVFVGKNAT